MKINAINNDIMSFRAKPKPVKQFDSKNTIINNDFYDSSEISANYNMAQIHMQNENYYYEDEDGFITIVEGGKVILKTLYSNKERIIIFYAQDGTTPKEVVIKKYDPLCLENGSVEKTYYNQQCDEDKEMANIVKLMKKHNLSGPVSVKITYPDGSTTGKSYEITCKDQKFDLAEKFISTDADGSITDSITKQVDN